MAIDRRGFLGVLTLAPAALAGCAAATVEAGDRRRAPEAAPSQAPESDALAAVRGFALAPGAEPALVFRAAAARPGER